MTPLLYPRALALSLLVLGGSGLTAAAQVNPSEDFSSGGAGWSSFWGRAEVKGGFASLSTQPGKTHMGYFKKVTFNPADFPTVEVEAVDGNSGWTLLVKPAGGQDVNVLSGNGAQKVRSTDWLTKLPAQTPGEYEIKVSVGGKVVLDRITFLDATGNPPPGHNAGQAPYVATAAGGAAGKPAENDDEGVLQASESSRKQIDLGHARLWTWPPGKRPLAQTKVPAGALRRSSRWHNGKPVISGCRGTGRASILPFPR